MSNPAAPSRAWTRKEIVSDLRHQLAQMLRLESQESVLEGSLLVEDLGMDSLALVDLVTLVEERYSLKLASTIDLTAIKTLGGVADMVVESLKNKPAGR